MERIPNMFRKAAVGRRSIGKTCLGAAAALSLLGWLVGCENGGGPAGIPMVTGLKAIYDTAEAEVRLSWNPADYGELDGYLVYRSEAGAIVSSTLPIAFTKDAAYEDTLAHFQPGIALAYEYRVRIRNRNEEIGRSDGSVRVDAPHPSLVRGDLRFRMLPAFNRIPGTWARRFEATPGDSLAFILHFQNPTRFIRQVEWFLEDGKAIRSKSTQSHEGEDTLMLMTGPASSEFRLRAALTDASGAIWLDSVLVSVIDDVPEVKASAADSKAARGDTLILGGRGSDGGKIVLWEWDVGNTGIFHTVSNPETSIVIPVDGPIPGNVFECILRATDEDGNSALDRLRFMVSPWRRLAPLPTLRRDFGHAVLDGKIYVAGGRGGSNSTEVFDILEVYDPSEDRWERKAPMPTPRYGLALVAVDDKLRAIGGRYNLFYGTQEIYDPATDAWTTGDGLAPVLFGSGFTYKKNGYFIEGIQPDAMGTDVEYMFQLNSGDARWFRKEVTFGTPSFVRRSAPGVAVLENLVVTLGNGIYAEYFPETARIEYPRIAVPFMQVEPAIAPVGNRILAISGAKAWTYDREANSWETHPAPNDLHGATKSVTIGSKVYILGGDESGRVKAGVEVFDPELDQ